MFGTRNPLSGKSAVGGDDGLMVGEAEGELVGLTLGDCVGFLVGDTYRLHGMNYQVSTENGMKEKIPYFFVFSRLPMVTELGS